MNKQKLIGLIIGIVLFIAVIAGLTYAYSSWTSDNMNKVVSSKCFNVLYEKGKDFTGDIMPSADYTGGMSVSMKMDIDSACNINAKGKIYLTVDETTSEDLYINNLLNYQVLVNGAVTDMKGPITSSGEIVIDVGFLNKSDIARTTYTIYVWINGEYVTNEHANLSFAGSVRSEAVQYNGEIPTVNLLEYINNLYVSGNPTLITQDVSNDQYYYSYQDDTNTWGLMNDGLKVSDTNGGGATTITDATALTSGTEGNIRYFGPSDSVNNYIYFNCSDYGYQTLGTCERWRIIGIVDGKVKIIRDEPLDSVAWDQDKNQSWSEVTTYSNNWETSSLKMFFNQMYYYGENEGWSDYYYLSGKNASSVTTFYLDKEGLNLDTRKLISESTWYLGGYSNSELYPNDIYNYERSNISDTTIYGSNPYSIDAKIGLMYSSDYSYGTDLTKCSDNIRHYDSSTNSYACKVNNWLYKDANQWLITPNSSDGNYAMYSTPAGYVNVSTNVFSMYTIRPVVYLKPELNIKLLGDGSVDSPYQVAGLPEVNSEPSNSAEDYIYILGSETPIANIDNIQYFDGLGYSKMYFNDISLSSDEILLVKYIGDATDVIVPNTFEVNGRMYNVSLLTNLYTLGYTWIKERDEYYHEAPYDFYYSTFAGNEIIETVNIGDEVKIINSQVNDYSGDDCWQFDDGVCPTSSGSVSWLFKDCKSLVSVPSIPSSTTTMNSTFSGCISLENAPVIPNSVISMDSTFYGCTSLVNAPEIPSLVTNISQTFMGCTNLTGIVRINSSEIKNGAFQGYFMTFYDTSKPITVEVPAGSTTYNTFSNASLPSNVTIKTFTSS